MNELELDRAMQEPRKCPQCGTPRPAGVLDGLCPACLLQQGASADTATQPEQPPFEPPSLAELAKLFPQLEVLSLLGKGGMGAVYKARQPALDRFVALKILPAQPASGPAFAERFNREARALARLSHPNIVGVHEFGEAGGLHYFIMEFVDGVNLRQLEKAGRLSPREALQIIPQICDALQYAHDEGVVHRDIKPENVLVDRKGRVKIADFGLAKILGRDPADLRLTGEGQVMGTPHYMAPEQVEHPLEVDHRADIYSLGVVFYEMLTGELPLGKFAPPSRKVQVDVRLDEVVLHALEKEPEHRYQHANQVKTDVETIAGSPAADLGLRALPTSSPRLVTAARWTARILGTLLLASFGFFVLAEGLPPIATQPEGVQLNFVALGLMLLGFLVGWKREGTAALLIASGWTLWQISEGRIRWNLFQTPLPVAALYGYCWWAAQGRRTAIVLTATAALGAVLGLGWLLCPANVFMSGTVTDAATGQPIANAELVLHRQFRPSDPPTTRPSARAAQDGRFSLYVGWYAAQKQVSVSALDYATVTTNLGPRQVGQRRVRRNFQLQRANALGNEIPQRLSFGPVIERVLYDQKYRVGSCIDLDSGRLVTIPAEARQADYLWFVTNGIDVFCDTSKPIEGLFAAGGVIVQPADSDRWSTMTPAEVTETLAHYVPDPASAAVAMTGKGELPRTYFFRTLASGMGLLQITGFIDNPPGVKVRYKLARAPNTVMAQPLPAPESEALRDARAKLAELRGKFTEENPLVRGTLRRIEDLERRAKQAAELAATEPPPIRPVKTVVLTRATNQWVGEAKDVRTVMIWTDSTVFPGEKLAAKVKRPDGRIEDANSLFFTRVANGKVSTSCSFSWFFKDAFGEAEAEAAVTQLRQTWSERPISLVAGKPLELFSVTNRYGGALAGYVEFVHSTPQLPEGGAGTVGDVRAMVWIQHYNALFPSLDYRATVPPCYVLRANANMGEAHTMSPAGPSDYHSTWFRPSAFQAVAGQTPDKETQQSILEAQLRNLMAQQPIEVTLGTPRLVFTLTNGSGEVFEGFLELVGPPIRSDSDELRHAHAKLAELRTRYTDEHPMIKALRNQIRELQRPEEFRPDSQVIRYRPEGNLTNSFRQRQIELARKVLLDVQKRIATGAVPLESKEVLDAELGVALAEAEFQDDALAAAKARVDHAGKTVTLLRKLHAIGQATEAEVEQAELASQRAVPAYVDWLLPRHQETEASSTASNKPADLNTPGAVFSSQDGKVVMEVPDQGRIVADRIEMAGTNQLILRGKVIEAILTNGAGRKVIEHSLTNRVGR